MSTRATTSRSEGLYPHLSERDVLFLGQIQCTRYLMGKPLTEKNCTRIGGMWHRLDELPGALDSVLELEQKEAQKHPFAWDPEFGYLSPQPWGCGHGLSLSCRVHLEALHLLGDLKGVMIALHALRLRVVGYDIDSITDTAHLYLIENRYSLGISIQELTTRFLTAMRMLVRQELNARYHLVRHDARLFADALARALAVLRSARLIAPPELADFLSPVRLAASMGFITGISLRELDETILKNIDVKTEESDSIEAADRRIWRDAKMADYANKRFAQVGLNARGKRYLDK